MENGTEAEYGKRRAGYAVDFASANGATQTLLLSVLAVLALLAYATYRVVLGSRAMWLALPLLALAVLLPLWQRARRKSSRALRMLDWYERALARVDGSAAQSGQTGEAFSESGHLYERDLNVLGPDSLFGLLATTRTALGQRALAKLLLHGAKAETVRARQSAVQELAPMLDLRERVALLGWSSFEQLPAESFTKWLNGVDTGLRPWMHWVLGGLTVCWLGLLIAAYALHQDLSEAVRNAAGLLAVQGAFCLWLRPRVTSELAATQRLAGQTAILRDGLRLLHEQAWEATLLRSLAASAGESDVPLKRLERSLMLVEQRAKEWYYTPAVLLAVGTHAAISLSLWRSRYADAMRLWVRAWAEFEALLAVGTYAGEHPENVFPEIVEGTPTFACEGLRHPLLPREASVANNVHLGGDTRFLLISGSNMAGKSTLLRAVGCNVVLALAGAPVCASSAKMSALRVGASLALVDSLAEGKSKFLAEVERLRDLVALAREDRGAALFLIDEIFSGTNSADRRVAAEAVLRGLIEEGAIGALSTHDLALAELAELPELHGQNVHMASPDESDPLGFDYRLKPGINRTTNALAIVRMLGLAGDRSETAPPPKTTCARSPSEAASRR